jgi:hypothetical protein
MLLPPEFFRNCIVHSRPAQYKDDQRASGLSAIAELQETEMAAAEPSKVLVSVDNARRGTTELAAARKYQINSTLFPKSL